MTMGSISLFLCLIASFFYLLHASHDNHKVSSTLFGSEKRYELAITNACDGDLYTALELISTFNNIVPTSQAGALHVESALKYILHADVTSAISLHKKAKSLNATLVPPLAALYLAQHMTSESSSPSQIASCPGLGDMFYVSAVSIKQIADNHTQENVLLGSKTMITLLADSGLSRAAEAHYDAAVQAATTTATTAAAVAADDKKGISTSTSTTVLSSLLFRGAVLIPAVYDQQSDMVTTRQKLHQRVARLMQDACVHRNATLDQLDEFTLSPTFYLVYQGYNDRSLLEQLRRAYTCAHPPLSTHEPLHTLPLPPNTPHETAVTKKKIRVGFVSSHLRRHSICKLFCGLFMGLDRNVFEVIVFAALAESDHDGLTKAVLSGNGWNEGEGGKGGEVESVVIGMTMVQNRIEVTRRQVDVLVFLDVGMEPSTVTWAMARLAPIQVCLWGHPVTTGIQPHMDYFVSSDAYHIDHDGSAHTRSQSNFQSNSKSKSQSNLINRGDFNHVLTDDVDDVEGLKDGYAQGFFTEPLIRMHSLGLFFDRGSSLKVIQEAVNATEPGLEQQKIVERLLIDRPGEYYHALTTHLTRVQTAQTKAQSKSKAQSNAQSNQSPQQERDIGRSWSLSELLQRKQVNHDAVRLIVCPQHLPKFHPMFDQAIKHMLFDALNHPNISDVLFVVLAGKDKHHQWRRTLMHRWSTSLALTDQELQATFGSTDSAQSLPRDAPDPRLVLLTKIAWLPSLSPDEYALILASGDVMVDPYPFGGGVTSLESLAVCTPVVTLPSLQTVPALTAGMIRQVFAVQSNLTVSSQISLSNPTALRQTSQSTLTEAVLIATNEKEYVQMVVNLLATSSSSSSSSSTSSSSSSSSSSLMLDLRKSFCQTHSTTHSAPVDVLFNSTDSVRELETFLTRVAVTASGQPVVTPK